MEGTVLSEGPRALPRPAGKGVPSQGPAGKGPTPGEASRKRVRAMLRAHGLTKGARTQGGGLR